VSGRSSKPLASPGAVAPRRPRAPRRLVIAVTSRLERWIEPAFLPPAMVRLLRISVNIAGATGAAYFAIATFEDYLENHRLLGVAFVAVQMWVVVAYLVRRPATLVSRRPGDWLLAAGGTFGGVLVRPEGVHPAWGVDLGLALQVIGLVLCAISFAALGRSFGFAAADRGLRRRGPYALVRHPIYASYIFLQFGYLAQSISVRNALVVAFVLGCNVGRALAEERVLAASGPYLEYEHRVRWRLVPGLW
jgi:protein-S-isoprenylcysteine O-methyltransferase Ste14